MSRTRLVIFSLISAVIIYDLHQHLKRLMLELKDFWKKIMFSQYGIEGPHRILIQLFVPFQTCRRFRQRAPFQRYQGIQCHKHCRQKLFKRRGYSLAVKLDDGLLANIKSLIIRTRSPSQSKRATQSPSSINRPRAHHLLALINIFGTAVIFQTSINSNHEWQQGLRGLYSRVLVL